MSQVELPDQGNSLWRSMPCPSCGQSVVWTMATPPKEKVACTNEVGERTHKRKCGFMLRRAEWDYALVYPRSAQAFIARQVEAFAAKANTRRK